MDIIKVALHFVEALAMMVAASGLIGQRFGAKQLLLSVVLYSSSVYGIRKIYELLHIPLGTHTLVLLVICTLLLAYVCKVGLGKGLLATMVVFVILLSGEVFSAFVLQALGIDVQQAFLSQPWPYTAFVLISHSLLWLTAILTYSFKVSIFGRVVAGR